MSFSQVWPTLLFYVQMTFSRSLCSIENVGYFEGSWGSKVTQMTPFIWKFALLDNRTRGSSKLDVMSGEWNVDWHLSSMQIMLDCVKSGTSFNLKTVLWVGNHWYFFSRKETETLWVSVTYLRISSFYGVSIWIQVHSAGYPLDEAVVGTPLHSRINIKWWPSPLYNTRNSF